MTPGSVLPPSVVEDCSRAAPPPAPPAPPDPVVDAGVGVELAAVTVPVPVPIPVPAPLPAAGVVWVLAPMLSSRPALLLGPPKMGLLLLLEDPGRPDPDPDPDPGDGPPAPPPPPPSLAEVADMGGKE